MLKKAVSELALSYRGRLRCEVYFDYEIHREGESLLYSRLERLLNQSPCCFN